MAKLLGAASVVLVAIMAAACTSANVDDEVEAESLESTSQALQAGSFCAGDSVSKYTSSCTVGSGTTQNITNYDIKTLKVRAQSFFAYIMGGPLPPQSMTVKGVTYPIRDMWWWSGTQEHLCKLRSGVAAGRVTVTGAGTATMCGEKVNAYRLTGKTNDTDASNCGVSGGARYAGNMLSNISKYSKRDRGWCYGENDGLPSFLLLQWNNDDSGDIDPETVVLDGYLSNSTGATAAAHGKDTSADYKVVRWPSTGGSCSSINTLLDASPLGVPCKTESGTGETGKYIQRSASGYCSCKAPVQ